MEVVNGKAYETEMTTFEPIKSEYDGDIPLDSDLNLDEFADFMSGADNELQILDTSPTQNVSDVINQLHGGHEEPFPLGNNRNDNSPPHQNGYASDGSYQAYNQKNSQLIENFTNGNFQQQQKFARSPQDQSFSQYKHPRCLPDSPPDSGSEPCSSPPEKRGFTEPNHYVNNGNLSEEQLQRHRLSQQQQQPHRHHHHRLQTLPGGSSPSGESTCSQQSGGSSTGCSYLQSLNPNHQQLSPHEKQVQIQQQEFENTLDSVRTSVANSRNLHHQQSMDACVGNGQSFHGNGSYGEQQTQPGGNFYVASGQSFSNPIVINDTHSPGSNGLPHSGQQHINPLMEQYLNSQMNGPPAKKRKPTDSPQGIISEQLSASQLNQQYQQMLAMQQSIKQEPGLTSPIGARGYYNDAYEMGDHISRHNGTMQRGIIGGSTISINSTAQMPAPGMSSTVLPHTDGIQRQSSTVSPGGPSIHYMENTSYQVIKWSPHQKETWCPLLDADYKDLPPVSYRVDADKGFNFAIPDDKFVCQKKNHFQVTVHIGVDGHPTYIKTVEGVKKIEAFYLNLYGIKYESINQTISIEQSQSDRSKKSFHPVKVDLPGNQVTKVTVGRLHFSETTSNNMRKKGRPNPDQRYFLCVVALQAMVQGKHYLVCASHTEKIIVRASNPGQFDSDAVPWQSGTGPDTIFHLGKVGINCDKPDESLVVHGNLKVTGRLMQPSDMRAKENIEEVDTKDQLKNVQNVRIVRYNYSPEYCEVAGIDPQTVTTGVLAQEFQKVMPNAVKDTGDVQLSNRRMIPHFLVVDKDQLFMENVGAVKELCNVTNNFETRIDQLEKWNNKLAKLKKYDSIRSNVSMFSGISSLSTSTGTPSVSRMGSARFAKDKNHNADIKEKTAKRSTRDSGNQHRHRSRRGDIPSENGGIGCLNQKLTSGLVIALFLVMLFSFVAMSTLYAISLNNNNGAGCTGTNCIAHGESNSSGPVSTDQMRSTTELPSSVTTRATSSNPTAKPISYCPDDGRTECGEDTKYCCVPHPGRQIYVGCLRDITVNTVISVRETPWKSTPTQPSGAPSDNGYGQRPHRFPDHKSKVDWQRWRHQHARRRHEHSQTPHPTMMEYSSKKEQIHSTSLATHIVSTAAKPITHKSKTKLVFTLNATEKKEILEKQKPEPQSAFDTDMAKPPAVVENPDRLHSMEEGIDDVEQDEIDQNPLPKTTRDKLPSSNVRKRVRRRALPSQEKPANDILAQAGLGMHSIRLVQPNVLLYKNENEQGYEVCSNQGNFSFNVPVSVHTPPGVPITIEFNTTAPGFIFLCTNKKNAYCPEIQGQYQPGENVSKRFRKGQTHRFVLLFSSYISSDYWFRLTTEDKDANCKTPIQDLGTTFHVFRFRFYRPCTPEPPHGQKGSPARDNDPENVSKNDMLNGSFPDDPNESGGSEGN